MKNRRVLVFKNSDYPHVEKLKNMDMAVMSKFLESKGVPILLNESVEVNEDRQDESPVIYECGRDVIIEALGISLSIFHDKDGDPEITIKKKTSE